MKQFTYYEEFTEHLKNYNTEDITEVDNIFNIYRNVNKFPIIYYSHEGIKDEIKKCINKEVSFEGDLLNLKFTQGTSLCRFLFPNLHKVEASGDKRTMYNKFYTDHTLKRAITMYFKIGRSLVPSQLRCAMELIGGTVATNFKPMNAKALYERYCPPNGVIYDFSCGFGGRMLGALSSKNNYTYIGVEPCVETYENLHKLGQYIEEVTGRTNSYQLLNKCSEDYLGELESVDFAFSSPPYFNLERYSDEPTQCYNKFPTLDEWLEGYVRPTIRNTYKMLKKNGTYAVNIADFKLGNKQIEFVNEWIRIAEEEGFTYKEQIHMKLETRRGVGHKKDGKNIEKKEGIFVFCKER